MRFVLLAQVAGAALFLAGCPGDQQVEPTGGGSGCPAGTVCPPGAGGGGGNGGNGGDGAGGAGNAGGAGGSGGSGQGGAGGNGAGGAGNGSGGASNGSGAGGSGGNAVCDPLESDLDIKLVDATQCFPLQPEIVQCQEVLDGPCCPISVVAKDSPEVVAYIEAFNKYKAAGCDAGCPPIPCPAMPKFKCTANANDPTTGVCTPVSP